MTQELALDVAILPPADVVERAIELNAGLPANESQGLVLDTNHLPHVTLTQQFVRVEELDAVYERLAGILDTQPSLSLTVTGCGRGSSAVWLTIERSDALARLHEELMEAVRGFERPGGTPSAFFEGDARLGDVMWVTAYRLKSSLHAFHPHITIGHGLQAPTIAPFTFKADTVAACHLGRFCTCRKVLRRWTLR